MDTHRFCIAPMMDWSDRHCRYFWRLMSSRARLYTEMITTGALIHGDVERHLIYNPQEHPVAVQLGGSDPADLAQSAKLCADWGYDEINLNVGCPSERVQNGAFGACLMNEPELVADCVRAMRETVSVPVTVKCRIGVDDNDSYEALQHFVALNEQAGCEVFIIHARKAWLSGLSPKQNREIPPLNYPMVYQIKKDFPALTVVLNGGLQSIASCQDVLTQLDGVMIGREAYQNPSLLTAVDASLFDDLPQQRAIASTVARLGIAEQMTGYIAEQIDKGARLNHITRHMLGLFNGLPRARQWRRYLSENACKPGAGAEVFENSLDIMRSVADSAVVKGSTAL